MKYGKIVLFAALAMLTSGCISYEYEGKEGTSQKETVPVYASADAIRKPYTVLGKATISGNTENVTRDKLMARLVSEAGKKGADAILITEQQMVPCASSSCARSRFDNDNDDDKSCYHEITRDMDMTYVNVRNRSALETDTTSYNRIIRAEYLQYKSADDKSEPAAKADAKADVKAEAKADAKADVKAEAKADVNADAKKAEPAKAPAAK